jgi:hypothetical protein
LSREIARCQREIAAIEALLRSGHADLDGLCLALSDWCAELRMLEQLERGANEEAPPPAKLTGDGARREDPYFVTR